MKFAFDPKYLPLLSRVAAKMDIRYYLNGIRVEPAEIGGVYLVATNGHIMAIVHDAIGVFEGDPKEYASIRVTPGLVSACKSRDAKIYGSRVLLDGKRLSLGPDFGHEHVPTELFVQAGDPIIHGSFPDWRRLIPNFSQLKGGGFVNGGVRMENLTPFDGRGKFSGLRLWHIPDAGETAATYIQMLDMPEMLGVVMPMRAWDTHSFVKHMPRSKS